MPGTPAHTLVTLLLGHLPFHTGHVPLLQTWKRRHQVCPGSRPSPATSVAGFLPLEVTLVLPNDAFGIGLVSSPLPTTGGCLVDHQLWALAVSPKSSVLSRARPQPVW